MDAERDITRFDASIDDELKELILKHSKDLEDHLN